MFHQRSLTSLPVYRQKRDIQLNRGKSQDKTLLEGLDAQQIHKNIEQSRNRLDLNTITPSKVPLESDKYQSPKPTRTDLIHKKSTDLSEEQDNIPQRLGYKCRCLYGDIYEGICRHAFDCLNDPRDREYIHDQRQLRMFRSLVQKVYLSNCAECGRQVLRYRSHHTMIPRTRQKLLVMEEAWRQKQNFYHMLRWIIRQGYYWPCIEDEISYFRCMNTRLVATPPVKYRIGQEKQDPMKRRKPQNYNERNHANWKEQRKQQYQRNFANIRQQFEQGRRRSDSSDDY